MPSSKRVEAIDLFDSFIGPVSMQPCCLRTGFYAEINNGDDMVLLEEWYSREDLERHIFSDNSQKILADMDLTEGRKRESAFIRFFRLWGSNCSKGPGKDTPRILGRGRGSLVLRAKGRERSLCEVVRIGPWLLAFDDFPVKQIGLQFC